VAWSIGSPTQVTASREVRKFCFAKYSDTLGVFIDSGSGGGSAHRAQRFVFSSASLGTAVKWADPDEQENGDSTITKGSYPETLDPQYVEDGYVFVGFAYDSDSVDLIGGTVLNDSEPIGEPSTWQDADVGDADAISLVTTVINSDKVAVTGTDETNNIMALFAVSGSTLPTLSACWETFPFTSGDDGNIPGKLSGSDLLLMLDPATAATACGVVLDVDGESWGSVTELPGLYNAAAGQEVQIFDIENVSACRVVVAYNDYDSGSSTTTGQKAVVLTSESGTLTEHTPTLFQANAASEMWLVNLNDGANFGLIYGACAGGYTWRPFSVSGCTITDGGASQTMVTDYQVQPNPIAYDANNIVVPLLASSSGFYLIISQATGGDVYHLGIAADNTHLYLTSASGGNLVVNAIDLVSGCVAASNSFGAATIANVKAFNNDLQPTVVGDGSIYTWGRDGNNAQLHKSVDSGSTFTDVSYAGWGSNDHIVGLLPNPLDVEDLIAVFKSGCVWQTTSGSGGWALNDSGPSACLVKAARAGTNPDEIVVAACDAGYHWSANRGESFKDFASSTGSPKHLEWVY